MKDLVSVIVPVYNVEKYLDECIRSILCQTYQNIEIILIDDGSSDSSNLICQKYKEKDSRIKVITKRNEGQAVARNIGIKEANGAYIYFLDSDDYIKPETIEKVLDYMKKNEADLCYFSGELLLEAKNLPWDKNMYKRTKSYAVSNGITVMNQLVKNNEYTCSNCMLMTKLSLIQDNNIQYTEGYIYEDNYFAFLLGMHSKTSCVLNEDFYVRRIREGSVMTKESVLTKRITAYKRVLVDFNSIKTEDKILSGLLYLKEVL